MARLRVLRTASITAIARIAFVRADRRSCGRWPLDRGAGTAASPIRRLIVLQKLPPHVLPGIAADDDRIDDAGCAVDDVERRMEALFDDLARGDRKVVEERFHPP